MDVLAISPDDASEYGWLGLRKFTNESLVQRILIERHEIPRKHQKNAIKQALQIRQCLLQAEEYFRSAKNVSDSIRPLLLYYGTLSLALAEILLKGDGFSSLDKARGKHAHHGLELSIRENPSLAGDLAFAAESIIAKPHTLGNQERFGTFELWHRRAKEQPLCAKTTAIIEPGKHQEGFRRWADQPTTYLDKVPKSGVSLLWCFQNTPALRQALSSYGIPSLHVKASVIRTINHVERFVEDTIITHPNSQDIVDRCMDRVSIPTRDVGNYQIDSLPMGYIIKCTSSENNDLTGGSWPNAVQSDTSKIFFFSDNQILNEFGIYYLGLYLLGNYCRYYPDFWMADFEKTSSLYFIASRFMSIAEKRLPLLIQSHFTNQHPIFISESGY